MDTHAKSWTDEEDGQVKKSELDFEYLEYILSLDS